VTSKQSVNGLEAAEFSAIGFRVGEEEYGLRLTAVQEIVTTPHITRVPKAPDYIKGVINLHGNVVPVIDIARRFDTGETRIAADSRIVVVEEEDEAVGILAESVSKVARFHPGDMQPPPPLVAGIAAEFLEGVVRLPNRFLIFLNLERTLADDSAVRESDAGTVH
jgi:purine-binding chemotaxis protein CheW